MHFHRACIKTWGPPRQTGQKQAGQQKQNMGANAISGAIGYRVGRFGGYSNKKLTKGPKIKVRRIIDWTKMKQEEKK